MICILGSLGLGNAAFEASMARPCGNDMIYRQLEIPGLGTSGFRNLGFGTYSLRVYGFRVYGLGFRV